MSKRGTRRFKFENATPERLAKALLRQVPKDDTARSRVKVQLAEDEPAPDDPNTGTDESGSTNTSLRDDPDSSSTT